jgi:glycine/D-amino acid oxidase-like deaminating enzyme
MINEHSPVTFHDALPESVDVVVIGAGVIGIATAWFLTKGGLSVLVCDKGRVAGEQSSRNWGWIRQQGRDYAELPIVMDSIGLWESLAREIDEDIGFTRKGVIYLGETEAELAEFEAWLDIAKQHGLDTRMLNAAEVDELITDKQGQWRGALYTASDARAEPFKAVPALARAVQKLGCRIRENCAVRLLDCQAGAVSGVVTEHGRVRAQAVVCAGGAWSSMFVRNLGIDLPQLSVRSTVARTAAAPDVFAGNAASHDFAFRRRADGGYTLALGDYSEHFIGADSFRFFFEFLPSVRASWRSTALRFGAGLVRRFTQPVAWDGDAVTPFERTRVLDPEPCPRAVERLRARLARRLPALSNLPFEQIWAGMIDATPDVVPYMDAAPSTRGFFIATGFSGHGFGIGPGAGRVMADIVQGREPAHDLTRFRLSRFSDGSPIELGPLL